jgi:hypothetical protein
LLTHLPAAVGIKSGKGLLLLALPTSVVDPKKYFSDSDSDPKIFFSDSDSNSDSDTDSDSSQVVKDI